MIKLQLINADIIDDTDTVTSRLFRKSFNCRYNPRMDYAFCLLTLKSSEKWRSHYLVLHATSMTKFYLRDRPFNLQKLTLGYMTKTLNQIIFFSSTKIVLRDRLHSYIIFTLSLFINAERRMVIQI
jgi:hypothetical protein